MSAPALAVRGLRKTFRVGLLGRPVQALREVSFCLEPGRVLGYLGPNGSGKTTSIKCILGLIRPTAGQIALFGQPHDGALARVRVGYLPEHPYFYDYLTAREVLDYAGRLYGLPAAQRRQRGDALLERLGLGQALDRPLRGFSKGMLQRVGVAQSLISDPDLLIYDEPLSGLDPLGRKELRELLAELRGAGKTLFLTSHVLSDLESLCDEVVILRRGAVVAQGRLDDLLRRDRLESAARLGVPDAAAAAALQALPGVHGATLREGELTLRLPTDAVARLGAEAERVGAALIELHPVRDTLEELFVREALAVEPAGDAQETP